MSDRIRAVQALLGLVLVSVAVVFWMGRWEPGAVTFGAGLFWTTRPGWFA